MRYLVSCALLTVVSFAQPLSFGVKAGVPASDSMTPAGVSALTTNFPTYTVGPTIQFSLDGNFAVELDALYQPVDYFSLRNLAPSTAPTHTTGNSWEFPLVLKYALFPGPVRPFVEAGASARVLGDLNQAIGFQILSGIATTPIFSGIATTTTTRPAELRNRFTAGYVMGGGVDLGARRFHVSAEFRYTRWGWENFLGIEENCKKVA